jgi:uncharacterized protein YecT (DUF1311 family)
MNMTKFFLTIAFSVSLTFSFGQSNADMIREAAKIYEKSDKELNQTYQKILKEYNEDIVFIRNLKNAQRIWVQLRDAELKSKYPNTDPNYYGGMHPMCEYYYLTELTNERIKRLKVWLNGIEEGDICIGSVKIK